MRDEGIAITITVDAMSGCRDIGRGTVTPGFTATMRSVAGVIGIAAAMTGA